MIAHGAGRFTKDIDLLIDDAPENVACVRQALSILADNAAAEIEDLDVRTYVVVRVVDEVIIDLMGRACGLSYAEVVADSESREILGVAVVIASPATLILTKDTCRPQDAIDPGVPGRRCSGSAVVTELKDASCAHRRRGRAPSPGRLQVDRARPAPVTEQVRRGRFRGGSLPSNQPALELPSEL